MCIRSWELSVTLVRYYRCCYDYIVALCVFVIYQIVIQYRVIIMRMRKTELRSAPPPKWL